MSRPRLIAAVAALILGIGGTVGMVAYVRGAEERAASGELMSQVFVVTSSVPAGTPAERLPAYTTPEQVPQKLVTAQTVGDLADIDGLVTDVELLPGEIVSAGRFVDPVTFERDADRLIDRPPGTQEVTIALEPDRAGGGLIVPGDTVGVIMSFEPFDIESELPVAVDDDILPAGSRTNTTTHQTLHKLLVTNVQLEEVPEVVEREGIDDEADVEIRLVPSGNLLVTLAVDVATAERLIFGAEFGSLWLTNEPDDTVEGPSVIQTRGTIHQGVDDPTEIQAKRED